MTNYEQIITDAKDLGTLLAVGYLALKDETLSHEEMRTIANKIMERKAFIEDPLNN